MPNFLPLFLSSQSNVRPLLTPTPNPMLSPAQADRLISESSDHMQSEIKRVAAQWSCLQEKCTDSKYEIQLKKLHANPRFREKVQLYEQCFNNMSMLVSAFELYIYKEKIAEKAQIEVQHNVIEKTTEAVATDFPNTLKGASECASGWSIFSPFIRFWNGSPKNLPCISELEPKQDFYLEPYDDAWDCETICVDPIPSAIGSPNKHSFEKLEIDFDRIAFTDAFLNTAKPLLSELSQQLKTLQHSVPVGKKTPFWTLATNWSVYAFITIGGMFASFCLTLGVVTSINIFTSVVAVLVCYQAIFKVYEEFYSLYLMYFERFWRPVQATVCTMEILHTSFEKLIEQVEIRQKDRKQTLHHQESHARIEQHFERTEQLVGAGFISMWDCLRRLFRGSTPSVLPSSDRLALLPPDFVKSKSDF